MNLLVEPKYSLAQSQDKSLGQSETAQLADNETFLEAHTTDRTDPDWFLPITVRKTTFINEIIKHK